MDCKRFENQLMDAALGGLPPEHEAELRAHLRDCATCRGEFERQQELVSAMDRSLAEMAAVEPSPEMVARIRLKIAEQPEPSRGWLLGWWPAAAGALAAAALLAYLMFPGGTVQPPNVTAPTAVTSPQPTAPQQVAKALPSVAAKGPRRPDRMTPVAAAEASPAAPEVLVPEDQKRAVAWLYRTMQREPWRMNAVLAQEAQYVEEKAKPLEIARLSFAPLEIGPLEATSPDAEIQR